MAKGMNYEKKRKVHTPWYDSIGNKSEKRQGQASFANIYISDEVKRALGTWDGKKPPKKPKKAMHIEEFYARKRQKARKERDKLLSQPVVTNPRHHFKIVDSNEVPWDQQPCGLIKKKT